MTLTTFFFGQFLPVLLPLEGEQTTQPHLISPGKIQVLQSNLQGLTLSLDTPTYTLEQVTYASRVYDQFTLTEGELTHEPGQPQLPFLSGLIGIPPEAQVSLHILASDHQILPGVYTLPPGGEPLPAENDFEPAQWEYQPDAETYGRDEWLPAEPVQLGEAAWIRDQRVIRVTFFPFQYNPARRTVRWHPSLQAKITFTGEVGHSTSSMSPFASLFSQTLLNDATAQSFRTPLQNLQSRIPAFPLNSIGPRFDISVNQDGIYRITYEYLQAAGMDVDNIDPTTFHLQSQGEEIAVYVFGEGDGSFDPGDYLTFYGEKFRGDILAERYQMMMNPGNGLPANNWLWLCIPGTCDLAGAFEQYTDENIYSLTVGGTPSPRMTTVDGTPTGGTVPTVYTTTVRAEQSNYWWAFEFESEDVWFWNQIQRPTSALPYTTTYSITLPNVAPGYPATLHAEVASRNSTSSYPDHHTQFRFNPGTPVINDAYWDGRARYAFTASIPAAQVLEGENTLLFTMLPDVASGTTRMYFDFFEVTYARFFVALMDQLAFTRYAPGTWKYEISGFTSPGAEVYDITNPYLPKRVLNPGISGSGPYTVSFRVTDGTQANYFIAGTSALLTPANIIQYQPPDFASMPEADYLFITHEDFIPSLQPLASYRASQGLDVAIVDVDDLYREFNDGIYHPIAIKNFLAYTFVNWETPPLYVTLVGSGHWNFKNYGAPTEPYYNPPPVYMPPNLAYIDPWQGQTDSVNLLATLVGDDTLPDLHIARLPVSSPAELDVIVAKILAYETQPLADWQRNITFIADNIPDPAGAGDFIALAEGIISTYLDGDPYYKPVRIYENDYGCTTSNTPPCDAVTQAIIDTNNITGTLLMNYIGHGSLNRWSGESIFLNEDVANMTNASQLPVVLSMTCLDGYWLYPNIDSLARVFLISEGKGAVATYSPTGLGVATGHDDLQRGFFDSLFFNGAWELGQATLQSKIRLFATNSNFDLMHTFTLFGDPALHLPTPHDVALNPETASQFAPAGETVTYTLDISNPGLVTDTYSITLSSHTWDTSLSTPVVGPLPPGATTSISLTVTIPVTALGNQTEYLTVLATSQKAVHKTDASTLSTTALTDGLLLTPFSQSSFGPPGSVITYSFSLTNTSILTDVFNLSLSGNSWENQLSTPSLEIAPGDSQLVQVIVQIPLTALGNDLDQSTLTAQSTNDPTHAAVATATTTATTAGFTLTASQKNLQGYSGTNVTFNLQINNLLNTAEYYTISLTGQTWTSSAPVTVGPANPGAPVNFLVTVSIPPSATTGMSDTVTVTVTMLDDPSIQASSALTTIALEPPIEDFSIFLPVVIRP